MDNCVALDCLLASLAGICAIASFSRLTWINDTFSWLGSGCGARRGLSSSEPGYTTVSRNHGHSCPMLPKTNGIHFAQSSICTIN